MFADAVPLEPGVHQERYQAERRRSLQSTEQKSSHHNVQTDSSQFKQDVSHGYLMQHDGYKHNELNAGLRRGGSSSQSHAVSWRQKTQKPLRSDNQYDVNEALIQSSPSLFNLKSQRKTLSMSNIFLYHF